MPVWLDPWEVLINFFHKTSFSFLCFSEFWNASVENYKSRGQVNTGNHFCLIASTSFASAPKIFIPFPFKEKVSYRGERFYLFIYFCKFFFLPEGNTHSVLLWVNFWSEWHGLDISLLCGLAATAADSPDFFQNLSFLVTYIHSLWSSCKDMDRGN